MRARRFRPRLTYANVVSTVALLLVLGGGAIGFASIPASDGTVTACADRTTGAVRLIDTAAGGKHNKCTTRERRVKWSQKGPQGAGGPQGPNGANGANGANGLDGRPGSDAQFNGAAAGGDLAGTYPAPQIGGGAVAGAEVADHSLRSSDIAVESGSKAINLSSTPGQTCSEATLSDSTGPHQVGDHVLVTGPATHPSGMLLSGYVDTQSNLVGRFCNLAVGPSVDPPSLTYSYIVFR
jgi:hypothetical protein